MAAPTLPSQPNLVLSDIDKSVMTNIAVTAMEELIRLTQTNEPLWIKNDGARDVLNLGSYENMFPRASSRGGKNHNVRVEASRSSGVVFINAMTLVDMLMDSVSKTNLTCRFYSVGLLLFFSHIVYFFRLNLQSFFPQSLHHLKLLQWFHLDCVETTEKPYIWYKKNT